MRDGPVCYSVVVPVFNEAETLPEFHERLLKTCMSLGDEFEVIYVDDGSTDGTARELSLLQAGDARLRILSFSRNFGQHAAVHAGFHHARGEILITLDADLQNPPEEIPRLVSHLQGDVTVVAGVRASRQDRWPRRAASRAINLLIARLTGVRLRDYGCMMRVYRRSVIEKLLQLPEQRSYFTAMLAWLGCEIAEVEVAHHARRRGRSRYSSRKLASMATDIVTGFTILPISLLLLGGFLAACAGACVLLALLLRFAFAGGGEIPAVPLWIGVLLLLAGLQLIATGTVGEYVGRVLIEVRGRPRYVLKEEKRDAEK